MRHNMEMLVSFITYLKEREKAEKIFDLPSQMS